MTVFGADCAGRAKLWERAWHCGQVSLKVQKKKSVERRQQSAGAVTDVLPGQTCTVWTDDASPGVNSLLFDPGLRGRLGVLERPVRTKAREKKNSASPPVIFNGRREGECEGGAGEQMTSLTSFPAAPSLPCSPWEAKWKREPKKNVKGRESLARTRSSLLSKRNKMKLWRIQRNSGTYHGSGMPGGSWWSIHAMKTSLASGSLLTFDALTKEKMKDVNFSLSVMHFNCSSFRPIMF